MSTGNNSSGGNEDNAPTNALQQLTQQLIQLAQALSNGNGVAQRIADFHPPFYSGQDDPRVLDNWIRTFDKLFDLVGCPMDQKVDAAVFYLQQQADFWWMTSGQTLRQQPNFDWEVFKTAMRDQFYPEHVKEKKYEELLRQGNLSMQEYHTKFLELARLAPELVPDEFSKTQRFIRGLNFEAQKVICVAGCQTLNEAYNMAAKHYRIEQLQKKFNRKNRKRIEDNVEGNYQGDKRPRFNNQWSNKGFQGSGANQSGNGQGSQGQRQVGRNRDYGRHYHCKLCSGDHPGKDCQGNLVQCFKCNKLGHRSYECRVKGTGNQQGQRSNDNGGNQSGPRQSNHWAGNRNHNGGGDNGNKSGSNQVASNGGQNTNDGNNT